MAENEKDLGKEKLQQLMRSGEVFITNTENQGFRAEPFNKMINRLVFHDERSLEDVVRDYENGGNYLSGSVRVIDSAFDVNGDLVGSCVTIVGIPFEVEPK